jgi:NAD(P)H-flavin reductase
MVAWRDPGGEAFLRNFHMVGYQVRDMLPLPDNGFGDGGVEVQDGYTTVTFTRPFVSSVETVAEIDPSNAGIIWALAGENSLVNHYSSGMGKLNLASGISELVKVIVDYRAWVIPAAFVGLLVVGGLLATHTCLGEVLRGPLRKRLATPVHVSGPVSGLIDFFRDLTVVQLIGFALLVAAIVTFVNVDSALHGKSGLAYVRAGGWSNTWLFGLVTLPVSRTTLWLHVFGIPFERAVKFHTVVARLASISALAHLVTAMANFGVGIPLSSAKSGTIIPVYGFLAFLTMIVMVVTALPQVRRKFFEVFYYTHLALLPIFYLFAVLHCHSALHRVVLLAPLSLYVVDRLVRLSRRRLHATVVKGEPLQAGDAKGVHIRLQLPKAATAGFEAGGYFFLNVPEIDVLQWHPFSVSSAPHDDGTINFHILSMGPGTFTDRLVDVFGAADVLKAPPTVYVDGPLGRLQVDLKHGGYRTALLVAGGIGVTPMTSVLEDLLLREKAYPTLSRVVLVWVVRDPKQLQWLEDVVTQARAHSSAHLTVELRFHYTQAALDGVEGAKEAVHGRPDFNALVEELLKGKTVSGDNKDIEMQEKDTLVARATPPSGNPNQMCVLACGPVSLVAAVQTASHVHGVDFHKESFAL